MADADAGPEPGPAPDPAAVVDDLRTETEKWAERLDEALEDLPATGGDGEAILDDEARAFLDNVRAYRADADHFLANGDLVRAFEAVVWAWAWLEIGKERGILDA